MVLLFWNFLQVMVIENNKQGFSMEQSNVSRLFQF
jgi:hypothetical protein